jgi:hypothetical protein
VAIIEAAQIEEVALLKMRKKDKARTLQEREKIAIEKKYETLATSSLDPSLITLSESSLVNKRYSKTRNKLRKKALLSWFWLIIQGVLLMWFAVEPVGRASRWAHGCFETDGWHRLHCGDTASLIDFSSFSRSPIPILDPVDCAVSYAASAVNDNGNENGNATAAPATDPTDCNTNEIKANFAATAYRESAAAAAVTEQETPPPGLTAFETLACVPYWAIGGGDAKVKVDGLGLIAAERVKGDVTAAW